jgi:hypothetical protein
MELVRRRADIRAKETGSSRSEVMKNFIRNKGLLSAAPVAVGAGAAGGLLGEDQQQEPVY